MGDVFIFVFVFVVVFLFILFILFFFRVILSSLVVYIFVLRRSVLRPWCPFPCRMCGWPVPLGTTNVEVQCRVGLCGCVVARYVCTGVYTAAFCVRALSSGSVLIEFNRLRDPGLARKSG